MAWRADPPAARWREAVEEGGRGGGFEEEAGFKKELLGSSLAIETTDLLETRGIDAADAAAGGKTIGFGAGFGASTTGVTAGLAGGREAEDGGCGAAVAITGPLPEGLPRRGGTAEAGADDDEGGGGLADAREDPASSFFLSGMP